MQFLKLTIVHNQFSYNLNEGIIRALVYIQETLFLHKFTKKIELFYEISLIN